MRRYLIATHGSFAEGIKSSIELIIGKQENLSTICGYLTDDFDLDAAVRPHLKAMKEGDELVVMTDVSGGSINNLFMGYINHPGVHVITGLNFPLALGLLSSDENDRVEDIIADAIVAAKDGILYCNALKEQKKEDEDF